MSNRGKQPRKPDTEVVHLGRDPQRFDGVINVPPVRASTVLAKNVAHWEQKKRDRAAEKPGTYYGLGGTATKHALEEALAALEGGYRCQVYPSGLAACTIPILGYVKSGDHILVTDSVYGPTRKFCDGPLKRLGVSTTYYDPLIGAGIAALMQPNTSLVFVESPGSLTFEMQDIPAIAQIAHAKNAIVMMDNTWGTPLYFKPFEKGVDVSIQATTKYVVGHSDVIMGSVTCTQDVWPQLKAVTAEFGQTTSPDDCYLAARGLRSMAVRLRQHHSNGLALARFIAEQPEVERVLHPALKSDPGHALWKRDFSGACGLFGVVLKPMSQPRYETLIDSLALYGIGASWGGYESLAMPFNPAEVRSATRWPYPGPCFRVHAGLEDIDDLIADMAQAFEAMRATT